ncbi:MAG: acyl-CoA synthetase [Burkholderiales bacterium]
MNSTYELLRATADRVHDQVALQFLPEASLLAPVTAWSYGQLLEKVTRFANWLHARRVGAGDAVTIMLPIVPQWHVAFLGAGAATIANPVNPMLDVAHLTAVMKRIGTKVLVVPQPDADPALWAKVESIARALPSLRHVLTVNPGQFTGVAAPGVVPAQLGGAVVEDFDAAFAGEAGDRLLGGRQFKSTDVAAYYNTGGTTGHPKMAPHTHGNEIAMVQSYAEALKGLKLRGGKFLCGLPLFHVAGSVSAGLFPLSVGGSVLMYTAAGFRTPGAYANFWKLVERFGIQYFIAMPTIYSSLLEVPIGDSNISSLRYCVCGGAPLSNELVHRFESATGVRMVQGYGQTEAVGGTTRNPVDGDRPIGSIGQALPGVDVKIVELDGDGRWVRDCPDDVVGHLVVRGPNVFPGYLDEADNEGAMLPGGWLKSGDLARRDARGYFWLAGRTKDLIIRGGHNIDPALIEEPLLRHSAVAAVAAVGRPDRHTGEVPVAYVQLRPGHTVDVAELMRHAAMHIAEKAAVPKAIHIVEQIPLTPVGKPFKPALAWREIENEFARVLAELIELAQARVAVGADARRGAMARVSIRPAPGRTAEVARAAAASALGAYATRFEITVEQEQPEGDGRACNKI